MGVQAMAGVRVLEYCRGLSGPYCSKLLADLGAEVVHIEPPGIGDDTRRLPPFPDDVPHPEKSGLFLFLNTNKLGITLDPAYPDGNRIFRRLASTVDVLIDDWPVGHLESMKLGYEDLCAANPGLIMVSISPFGRSGPYAHFKAHGLNISHISGQGYLLPLPSPNLERAPVKIGGSCTDFDSGHTASVALLAALYSRGITGKGQFIEVSQQEAVHSLQRVENVGFANDGEILTRRGPESDRGITQRFECKDGYVVSVTPVEHQKQALAKLTHSTPGGTSGPAETAGDVPTPEALRASLAAWMRERTTLDASTRAQALSCPISPMSSAADVSTSPQLLARGFFAEVEHPVAGTLRMPARPCHFSRTPFEIQHAAPRLGEHNDVVYRDRLGLGVDEVRALHDAGVI